MDVREDEDARHRGLPAVPPRRRRSAARRAELAVETAKLASDPATSTPCPTDGSHARPRLPRHRARGRRCWSSPRQTGIGAQFGGKYFCHDVRIIRLPRHGASCPVAMAVSLQRRPPGARQDHRRRACSSSSSRPIRRASCPRSTDDDLDDAEVVHIDLNRPMDEIRAELSASYPVKTRVMLTGPMVVARDIAHAKIKERLDAGEPMPQYMQRLLRVLRRPGQDARGHGQRLVRPDHRRPDGQLRRPSSRQPAAAS